MFAVIGSITADLLVRTGQIPSARGADGFRQENLIFTQAPLKISMGGNGGNSAFVLAGLGAPTALGGAIGRDLLGDALATWLARRGVDLSHLHRSRSAATSTSTILIDDAGDQLVFHHSGSTAVVTWATLPADLLSSAEVLLATSYPIMSGLRSDGFARALGRVHGSGGLTALDIGPAIGQPLALDELAPLFAHVDYVLGNEHELETLSGEREWTAAAARVIEAGARQVVVKQGAHGATLVTPAERVHAPAHRVDVQVSVGAGDSFNAGFLYALWRGQTAEKALRFGSAVAAQVVGNSQGIHGAPTGEQVEALFSRL